MNLLTLQYTDICCSLKAAFVSDAEAGYAIRVQNDKDHAGEKVIILERSCKSSTLANVSNWQSSAELIIAARVLFPGSLLGTEIGIMRGTPKAATSSRNVDSTNDSIDRVLDHPVSNGLYYRLHEPLPEYFGTRLYRSGAHIVAVLKEETNLATLDPVLIAQLHSLINTKRPLPDYPESLDMLTLLDDHNSQRSRPRNMRLGSVNVEVRKLRHVYHRLNVIGKASLMLCDSADIAVDSIRSSVPVAFIGSTPSGFEKMQSCISRYLQHENYQKLVSEQQNSLKKIVQSHRQQDYVMSNQSTLRSLINTLQTSQTSLSYAPTASRTEMYADDELILCSQQSLFTKTEKCVTFKSGLQTGRRKFQKFKESPKRFMEDSQSRILRSLAPGKTPW